MLLDIESYLWKIVLFINYLEMVIQSVSAFEMCFFLKEPGIETSGIN